MPTKYDYILRGGNVIDPSQNIHAVKDVALAEGKVSLVADHIPEDEAVQVVDVAGKIVTPGLIDVHGHFTRGIFNYIDPDTVCLPNGVITAVDAGGLDWHLFSEVQERIYAGVQTRLYYLLRVRNLESEISEEAIEWAKQDCDRFVGCKVFIGQDTRVSDAIPLLEKALDVAERAQTRLVVHLGACPIPMSRVLKRLRPGDIATHIFQGEAHTILDWDHNVRPEVWDAVERGVLMDIAHCIVYFDSDVARAAIEQGLLPYTISTDISTLPFSIKGIKGLYNLTEVMSVFLEMGLSLDEVVRRTTCNAATAIGKSGEMGSLRPGTVGDVTVLQMEEGDFRFLCGFFGEDRKEVSVKNRLSCFMTFRSGQLWQDG